MEKFMQPETEKAIRKRVTETLRAVLRELEKVGDHGTASQINSIIVRMVERRAVAPPSAMSSNKSRQH